MTSCGVVERDLARLSELRPKDIPDEIQKHVGACRPCGRRLVAARLSRGLVASVAGKIAPSDGFSDRVMATIAARGAVQRLEPDVWRPAWGLLPTFAAAVAALFIVYQASEGQAPVGLLSTEGLTAGERLVLGVSAPDTDDVLTAVLEGMAR
jgi:hypothetical protein